jgi:hypothetical protein
MFVGAAMSVSASIFFDFNLPNATTWFYFSLLLAVALFLKFTRLLSVRNWDVLTMFLLVPGLLLLQEAHTRSLRIEGDSPASGPLVTGGVHALASPSMGSSLGSGAESDTDRPAPDPHLLWLGYLWLLCGSGYFLIRCLMDLALVRRPALSPNLNLSGLAWLGAALFICLVAVAVRRPVQSSGSVGKRSAAVNETQQRMEYLFERVPVREMRGANTRFWVESVSAIVCHLAIVVGLIVVGWRHYQDAHAGFAAATFYLLLPYTAYHVDQVHHVLPTAFLVWAVAAYRRPAVAGLLLGLAALTGYFPALLFPAWLGFYWRRGAGRFAAAFLLTVAVCLGVVALVLWLEGGLASSIRSTLALTEWQPWRQPSPLTNGFWTGVRWAAAYRMPVFIAYLAFVAATLLWPSPKNLAQLLALSAAVIIGIQFWFADQGGVYVLWYLPLLLLLVFRPNLADRLALPIKPDEDWVIRWRAALGRFASRLLRLPQPTVHVQ